MDIPVLLEPTPTGFRASTGAPLNLVAEGPTQDVALDRLKFEIVSLQNRGRLVTLHVNDPDPLLARLAAFREEDRGFLEEWAQAVKQIREDSGIPDPDEELFPTDPTPPALNGQSAHAPGAGQPVRP
jgi:hypothetical protein